MSILTIFAEGEQAGGGAASILASPMFLIVLMGLFFFVVILPGQRRQKREQAEMMANLKNGANVVLSGGIVGTIIKANEGEDEIVIRSEDTKLRVLRSSIVRVVTEATPSTPKA
jgi:preprotein translocase subunit YajC